MDIALICAIIILLSIDYWLRNSDFHFTFKKHHHRSPDYHQAFTHEGIELDEPTYKSVIKFMEEGNIEAAEYLIMIRCKCPLKKVRHAIDDVYENMYGVW